MSVSGIYLLTSCPSVRSLALVTERFQFSSPVSVICGPNGVGKSTLLRLLWATLDPASASKAIGNAARLSAGSGHVCLQQKRLGETISRVEFPLPEMDPAALPDFAVTHVDTATDVTRVQAIFASITDLEAFLNGAGETRLGEKDCSELGHFTRRTYSSVVLYEVELADETVPFFEVQSFNQAYDSRTMGSGELASFLIWWNLARMQADSIMLLEEPESFLSPISRMAFVDTVLKHAFERPVCVVMTSHSGEIISALPEASIKFFRRDKTGVSLAQDMRSPALLETIGIETQKDILVIVEDAAATAFVKLWFERFEVTLSHRTEVVFKGGDGEVIKSIKGIGGRYNAFAIIGIFDGDIRGKIPKEVEEFAFFLPGEHAIEIMFRSFVVDRSEALQVKLPGSRIGDILFRLDGVDHHDWFEDFAKALNLSKDQLFHVLFNFWIEDEANYAMAQSELNGIKTYLELA